MTSTTEHAALTAGQTATPFIVTALSAAQADYNACRDAYLAAERRLIVVESALEGTRLMLRCKLIDELRTTRNRAAQTLPSDHEVLAALDGAIAELIRTTEPAGISRTPPPTKGTKTMPAKKPTVNDTLTPAQQVELARRIARGEDYIAALTAIAIGGAP